MRDQRRVVLLCFAWAAGCGGTAPVRVAAPVAVPEGTVRYIVGGDSRNDAANVLPWAFGEAKARGAEAFFFLGDMELSPGYDDRFVKALGALDPVQFYPALGNHEVMVFGFLPIGHDRAEHNFRARFLEKSRTPIKSSIPGKVVYSVDLPGGMHFIALDNVSQAGFGDDQLVWLAADLENARHSAAVKHIVAGMHKPLARNGVTTHSMDGDGAQAVADSDAALAVLASAHTELILASHVHEFANFTQSGIASYITGGLGAPLTASGPDHAFHHFLQLDVTDQGIGVVVVRFPGKPSLEGDSADDDPTPG